MFAFLGFSPLFNEEFIVQLSDEENSERPISVYGKIKKIDEAKENLVIQDESQTLASITYQNLFLLYEKLSGMTGTAKTEELEFEKIWTEKNYDALTEGLFTLPVSWRFFAKHQIFSIIDNFVTLFK